ncbi:putative Molybdenum cofactor sulfurase [Glarea lozoyensis 74030]|uniref:Putative Molybdenum cofactor sulfurase n=1 Tax=Glarea lozoyensis (strain ATCC 74030 / MF5533) TaxID=1104152 RepID=H0EYJ1_GLAL7|nr:putative Molybdenum cofactor sulfurase [Glarea lozoyensis 74030]
MALAYNEAVESMRKKEYPMLQGKVYLDHGGTTVYSKSLVHRFSEKLTSNLYGNPHSESDPAALSGQEVDKIREQALLFFNANPEHFDLIFTANATAAIKLVGESFRDLASGSSSGTFSYTYHKDSHTSLVGLRNLADEDHKCLTSDEEVEEWLSGQEHNPNCNDNVPGLFAYPGQSNMTGRRLPLSWPRRLRFASANQNIYSLLDAAALATTSPLDFRDPHSAPDFTAVSFYKIFGFPDLGGLIVRRATGHVLTWRKYFGGGTVNMLTVLDESRVERKDATIHDALEDGTLPFHNIIALGCAIDVHHELYGSMSLVSKHTNFLAQRLYRGILSLQHGNGRRVCIVHNDNKDDSAYDDAALQGATVAFNVVNAYGRYFGHPSVERLANENSIYLRSGGLCNPGGIAHYLRIEPWQFKRAWSAGYRCGGASPLEVISGKPIGVVRASLDGEKMDIPEKVPKSRNRSCWSVAGLLLRKHTKSALPPEIDNNKAAAIKSQKWTI